LEPSDRPLSWAAAPTATEAATATAGPTDSVTQPMRRATIDEGIDVAQDGGGAEGEKQGGKDDGMEDVNASMKMYSTNGYSITESPIFDSLTKPDLPKLHRHHRRFSLRRLFGRSH
ncbi:hypothetical protein BJ085DRAFT_35494, partial [Dimargaris cristalligena]